MGIGAFESVMANPAFQNPLFYLEVPGFENENLDIQNVGLLKGTRQRVVHSP
jgi:hypothetical protein